MFPHVTLLMAIKNRRTVAFPRVKTTFYYNAALSTLISKLIPLLSSKASAQLLSSALNKVPLKRGVPHYTVPTFTFLSLQLKPSKL